jgi:hypothetical protein
MSETVSVVMERPIDSSGNLFRRRKRDGRKRKKGAAAAGYARQPKNQLTAVERRDSDRKRNTPMIIGSCRKSFGYLIQKIHRLMRPSHSVN